MKLEPLFLHYRQGLPDPLLPALADPDAVKNQLPADSKIEVGTGGQTTISDLGVAGSDKPVVGMPSPLLVQSDKAPGAYRDGTGPDALMKLLMRTKLRLLLRHSRRRTNSRHALSGFGATDLKVNTSGTMDLKFNGQSITLKPHFDIETKTDASGEKSRLE